VEIQLIARFIGPIKSQCIINNGETSGISNQPNLPNFPSHNIQINCPTASPQP